MRGEQDGVDRAGCRAQILLVLLEVPAQGSRGKNQRRRAIELRRFARAGSLLQAAERLRTENAKAPRVRPMVVRSPTRELEQLVERVGRDGLGSERLVRPARTDQFVEGFQAADTKGEASAEGRHAPLLLRRLSAEPAPARVTRSVAAAVLVPRRVEEPLPGGLAFDRRDEQEESGEPDPVDQVVDERPDRDHQAEKDQERFRGVRSVMSGVSSRQRPERLLSG
jgi:hypothetical protein